MRLVCVLVVASGCNQVFGLRGTELIDAAYFDAPLDAAPHCPSSGGEPMFRRAYVQVPVEQCFAYVPSSSGQAFARCGNELSQGPVDGELRPAVVPNSAKLDNPRLAPEGDAVIVHVYPAEMLDLYHRNGDDSWSFERTVYPAVPTREISTPSRGPDRRVIVTEFVTDHYQITELADTGGSPWQVVDSYSAKLSSIEQIYSSSLTADGLHLVFRGQLGSGESGVLHAERPSLSSRFGAATFVSTVPAEAETPFMTEDCGRIYFSAIGTVFYLAY